MEKSKNAYIYPVKIKKGIRISYTDSPAHKEEWLKYSVDFIMEEGTPIRAAASGTVDWVKQDSNIWGKTKKYDKYGNFIEIEHKNDEYSIYEHIKKKGSLVKVGQKVKAGQIIGYSGNTGWMAHLGPHLHFDVHKYFGKGMNDYNTVKIVWKKNKSV